jgi:hypothetical protein
MSVVLTGMIAVLAVSAAPASAWWEATGKQWKGSVNVIKSGEFVTEGAVKATVVCPENEINAKWSIQTKGQIKIHEKAEKQLQTKTGPHLNFQIKWGKACTTALGADKVPVIVKDCELQLVQNPRSFTATVGVVKECVLKFSVCEIIVPAGMETEPQSNKGHNVGLEAVSLVNVGVGEPNQLDKINVENIQLYKPSNTPLCPVATNAIAKLIGAEWEVIGARAI